MSTVLRSVKGCQRAVTCLAAGAAMLLGGAEAVASGGGHGVGIATQCQGPICVGDTFECTITIVNSDSFGDTLRIDECFVEVDPGGAMTRVPAVGNLPVMTLVGNAAFLGAPGELPVILGAANSTLQGLPGLSEPGAVVILQDQYQATQRDCDNAVSSGINALISQATVQTTDLCDDPDTSGCNGIPNIQQFTAAGPISCPTVTIDPPDLAACEVDFPQQMCAEIEGAIGEVFYTWTGPNGFLVETDDPCVEIPAVSGEYMVCAEDSFGCSGCNTATVTVYPDPTITADDVATCVLPVDLCPIVNGGTPEYTLTYMGPNDAMFLPVPPDGCIDADRAGIYTIRVVDANGCMDETTAEVTADDDPACEILGPAVVCPGQQGIMYNANETTGAVGAVFTWTITGDAEFCDGSNMAMGESVCVNTTNDEGECNSGYSLTVTVSIGDCSSMCFFDALIQDDGDPIIVCPPNEMFDCPERIPGPALTFNEFLVQGGSASDDCGVIDFMHVGDQSNGGTCPLVITRTYRVTDACGNTAECMQTLMANDTEDPTITCPPDLFFDCPDRIPGPALDLNEFLVMGGEVSDNCEVVEVIHVGDTDNGQTCPYVVTRTYRAIDACGNEADCVQTLTADDTEDPTITCPADVLVDCPERIPGPALDLNEFLVLGGEVSDNCEIVDFMHVGDTDNGQDCPYVVTRTYRVVDACGNDAVCVQTLTADDTEDPTITCPADLVVSCPTDAPPAAMNLNEFLVQGGEVADNCVVESVIHVGDFMVSMETDFGAGNSNPLDGLRAAVGGQGCLQTINRVYRATDACGNTADCTQVIEINDQELPTITCPPDVDVDCLPHVPMPALTLADFQAQGGTAFDNCGLVDFFYDGDQSSGTTCPILITRTYRVVDACGNENSCEQLITVDDQVDPVLTCPADVQVACAEQLPAPALTLPEFIVQGGTAVDNCGIAEFFYDGDQSNGQTCPQTITRTYRAVDACGNEGFCIQTITIWDQEDPTITCPPAASADCPERIPAPAMDLNAFLVMGGTASDNCGIADFFYDGDQSNGQTCPETITRTYRVVDTCGNENTCTQIITVDDDEDPTITCPSDVTVACESLVPPPAANLNQFLVQGGQAADNCGITVFEFLGDTPQGDGCPLVLFREYRVEDACGNEASCIQTITVDDDEPPVVICPPQLQVDCVEQVPPPITTIGDFINQGGTIEDNCEIESIEFLGNITEGTCPTILTRGYRVTDACGNASECERTIIIDDQTPPLITCPPDVDVDCPARIPAPAMTYNEFLNQGGSIEDNCLAEIVTWEGDEIVEGSAGDPCPLVIRRRYTSWDLCGNSLECFQTITVFDEENPTITCPPDETVDCPARIPAPAMNLQEFLVIGGEVADNCMVAGVTWLGDDTSGDTCPQTITRTYQVEDACGNTSTCDQTIVVDDDEDPTITCPPDVMFSCQTSVPPPAADLNAFLVMGGEVADNCGIESFQWDGDQDSGGTCPRTISRSYSVTDECGNTNSCTQTITIWDQEDPTITCPPDVQVNCPTGVPAAAVDLKTFLAMGGTASDNCGIETFEHVGDSSDQQTCPETITRTYRVTDDCGNAMTCDQIITVYDEVDPTITCPADLEVNCPTGVPPAATDLKTFQAYGGTAFDQCGIETFEHVGDTTQGDSCPLVIFREYRVADACGNDAVCIQTITVNDEIDPTITCPSNLTVPCIENVPVAAGTLEAFQAQGGFAFDNCGIVAFTWLGDTPDGQTCPMVIERRYEVTDACGNTAECTQTITVNDQVDPVITCPPTVEVDCPERVPAPATDLNAFLVMGGAASDNCGIETFEFVSDVPNGQSCPMTITRTYRVTDFCGNDAECMQTIVVDDDEDPTITCPPAVLVDCPENVPAPAADLNAFQVMGGSAADNCGIVEFLWEGDSPDGQTCPMVITRTYRVVDFCGNTNTCQQTITVDDQVDPIITCPNNVMVSCPEQVPAPAMSLSAFQALGGTASDNCGDLQFFFDGDEASTTTCPQVITRSYRVVDTCGNTASCQQIIMVNDDEDPTITCPPDGAYDCPARVPAAAADLNEFLAEGGMADDNCGIVGFEHVGDMNSGTTCPMTITRTYRVTDACGNDAECSQTIVVNDEEDPTITCPADVDVSCPEQVPGVAADLNAFLAQGGMADDNCGIVDFLVSSSTNSDTCPQTITRTYTVRDACGNEASCDQVITVNDDENPTITCPPDGEYDCPARVPDPATDLNAFLAEGGMAADNCSIVEFEHVGDENSGTTCPMTITRTYRVTDACGNSAECDQTIIVTDDEDPTITCPADVDVDCAEQVPPVALDLNAFLVQGGTAADNCGIVDFLVSSSTNSDTCPQTITRTYTVRDACGNEASCDQVIVVNDDVDPVITCPPDGAYDCPTRVPDPATDLNAFLAEGGTASDNCGIVDFEHVGDTSNGTCPLTITRTYRVTDGCGNTADCDQTFVVDDDEDPTITCPPDVTVSCPEQVPPAADDLNAFLVQGGAAADNCGIVDFSVSTMTSGDGCPQTITRTYTVTDACGNEASCNQVITVNDDEDPTITCPSNLTVECEGQVPPAATDLESFLAAGGSVSDNCGDVTVEFVGQTTDGQGCPIVITRTYRATDACGNTADCMQLITVDDDVAPIITCPSNVTVSCLSEVPPANPAEVSCVDNCTPLENLTIELVNETQTGDCPIIITRTWRCEDECGNADECDQVITVEDITAPVITCPGDRLDLECDVAEPFMVEATDDCGFVEVTCEIASSSGGPVILRDLGNGQFSVEFEGTGTATISCTATDACGNPSTCTFDVAADCPCTIGDFLWYDLNGDGCQDPGEPGVPNVTLVLYRDCDDPVFVASTSTDDWGNYLFENIDCNTEYVIVIESTLTETTPDACGDDNIDSDCIGGMICLTTHSDNPVDLRYDCGFVECDLAVDVEGCVIPGDDDDDGGDECDGKVLELIFQYTAEDCSASVTTQAPDKWNCDTWDDLPDTAYIVVSQQEDCSGDIYFAGDVSIGDELTVDPSMAGEVELTSRTYACIYDFEGGSLIQSLEFHTSCSQPLAPGNQFGSLLLVQMTTTNGGTVGQPGTDPPDGECITKIVTGGGDCDGDLLTLDLTYTGESCAATSTTQSDDKWDCSGDPGGAEPVRILVSNESGSEVYADVSNVMIGETVFASAANAGQADFENQTRVRVYSEGGALLQDVDFHTSCSQPLGPGDQFGSLLISGLSSTGGGSSQMGGEVKYTYTVTNEGVGPVTNVTVIDDVYGEIPGSPIPLLEPGETVVLMITVFVTETTTNTVVVTGNLDDADCTAEDDATIMVVGPPHDCCEAGKPRVLSMLYTAEDCSATSHTQDPGKVNCDDYGPLPDTVYILSTDNENPNDGGALVWFSGTVNLGEVYDLDAANEGLTRLKNATFIHIFASQGGALLQSSEFHTSCSQDLNEGNQFGASILVGCIGENEGLLGTDAGSGSGTSASGEGSLPTALIDCPGDFDTNDVVGTSDMIMIFEFWGPVASNSERYDVSGDGQIDTQDLVEIVTNWGPCP